MHYQNIQHWYWVYLIKSPYKFNLENVVPQYPEGLDNQFQNLWHSGTGYCSETIVFFYSEFVPNFSISSRFRSDSGWEFNLEWSYNTSFWYAPIWNGIVSKVKYINIQSKQCLLSSIHFKIHSNHNRFYFIWNNCSFFKGFINQKLYCTQ